MKPLRAATRREALPARRTRPQETHVRLPRIRLVWPLPRLPRRQASDGGDVRYAPRANGQADPGEVVWAWVPFEEGPQPRQGPAGARPRAQGRGAADAPPDQQGPRPRP